VVVVWCHRLGSLLGLVVTKSWHLPGCVEGLGCCELGRFFVSSSLVLSGVGGLWGFLPPQTSSAIQHQ